METLEFINLKAMKLANVRIQRFNDDLLNSPDEAIALIRLYGEIEAAKTEVIHQTGRDDNSDYLESCIVKLQSLIIVKNLVERTNGKKCFKKIKRKYKKV